MCLEWLRNDVGLSEGQIEEARDWLSHYDAPGKMLKMKHAKKHINMSKKHKKSLKDQLIKLKTSSSSSVKLPTLLSNVFLGRTRYMFFLLLNHLLFLLLLHV